MSPLNKMKPTRAVLWILIFLMVVQMTACSIFRMGASRPGPTPAQQTESKQIKIAAITDFIDEKDLRVIPGEKSKVAFGVELQVYSGTLKNGDQALFEVDANSGAVIGFYRFGQTPSTVKIDLPTAQDIALRYAKAHYAHFSELGAQPPLAKLVDQGSSKYFQFWWVRVDAESGAYLPQEVIIHVNPETGQVDDYMSKDVTVDVPTQPKITQDEAVAIARAEGEKSFAVSKVAGAILFVSTVPVYDPKGE